MSNKPEISNHLDSLIAILGLDMDSMHAHAYPGMLAQIEDVMKRAGYEDPAQSLQDNPDLLAGAKGVLMYAGADNLGVNRDGTPVQPIQELTKAIEFEDLKERLQADREIPDHLGPLADAMDIDRDSMHAHAYPGMLQDISDVFSASGYTEPAHELVENNPAMMAAASQYLSHAGADNIGYNPLDRFEGSIVEAGRMQMAEMLNVDFNDPYHGWSYEQMMPHIETVLRYNGITNPAEGLAQNPELMAAAKGYLGTAGADNLGYDPFEKLKEKVANSTSGELTASFDEAPRRVFDDGAAPQAAQYMIRCEGRQGFSVTNVADPSDTTQITGKFDSITGPQFAALGLDEAQIAFLHDMKPGGAMTADLPTDAIAGLEGRLAASQLQNASLNPNNDADFGQELKTVIDGGTAGIRGMGVEVYLYDKNGEAQLTSLGGAYSLAGQLSVEGVPDNPGRVILNVEKPDGTINQYEMNVGDAVAAVEYRVGEDAAAPLVAEINSHGLEMEFYADADAVHGGLSAEAQAQIEAAMEGFDQDAAMAELEQKLEEADASPKCGDYGDLRTRCGSGAFTWNEDNLLPSPEIPDSIEPPESCLTSDYNGIANEYNSAASVAELRADPADPGSSPAAIADSQQPAPGEPNVQMAGNFLSMNNLA